ncbi:MAG TPA: hypothetical protein VLK58_07430 [Conexibacter sp.]|nr:hypothetical protein [Conexibacter sp.]
MLHNPTPLRVIASEAAGVESDGVRFAVVGRWSKELQRYRDELFDSWTGRRSMLPDDCSTSGVMEQTTTLTAGRMLLDCSEGGTVLDLASGRRRVLSEPVVGAGLTSTGIDWISIGRRWAHGFGTCTDSDGANRFCDAYVDFLNGATRVFRYDTNAPAPGGYRDLDAPGLPWRSLCRRTGPIIDEYHRVHVPPYWVGGRGLRRCRDGTLVRDVHRWGIPSDFVDGTLALAAGVGGNGRAGVYDLARDRVLSWQLPQVGRRRRPDTTVAHTRCAVYFAATLRRTDDLYVASTRVFRADMPSPHDPRCEAR